MRKVAPFLAAIIAVFIGFTALSTPVFALDAGWNGDTLMVGNEQFTQQNGSYPTVPDGSTVYVSQDATNHQAKVIYFAPGTDLNNAASADYIVFNFNPPSDYSNPHDQQPVTVAPKSGAQPRTQDVTGDRQNGTNQSGQATSCAITGIGWIVCPVTRAAAAAMDKIFDLLKGFFDVQTITLDTNNPTYRMWEVVRGLANLCFIVAFLVIIYSQITSVGMNNYNIKKMIPKLIIAAILVNISYYICAAAVDISNILGHSIEQMFIDMKGQIVGPNTKANTAVTSWQSITAFVLSGGALAGAGITAAGIAVASGASILSLAVILIPFLMGVIFSAIIALLILAARQALIVVLIAVAPLAFVAMLLPSTEKMFHRWRELLQTLLIMFPIFSAVFGGAQLAGGLIVQTATSIHMMLVGMFVQVAPLVVTPLVIRFSGGLLGRIAGMVNNKQKGFIDTTRNKLKEQDTRRRHRRIAEGYGQMAAGQRGFGMTKRWAARRETGRHNRDHDDKAYQALSEAEGNMHWKDRLFNEENDGNQTVFTPGGYRRRRLDSVRNAYASTYGAQSAGEMLEAEEKRHKEEAKAGNSSFYGRYGHGVHGGDLNEAISQAALETNLENQAAQSATRVTNRHISDMIEGNVEGVDAHALQIRAAGIDTQFGQSRALANAIEARVSDRSGGLKNIETMLDVRNLDSSHLLRLANGDNVLEKNIENSHEIREVAIKKIASGGNIAAINTLGEKIDLSKESDEYWRTAFVDGLKANGAKPSHYSAQLLDKLSQGLRAEDDNPLGFGRKGVELAVVDALNANKFDAKGLISNDKDTLRLVDEVLSELIRTHNENMPAISHALETAIKEIAQEPQYKGQMGNRKAAITRMGERIGMTFGDDW